MSETGKDIWFPAKTYGWGWGLPVAWQGWVVLVVYAITIFAGIYYMLPAFGTPVFLVHVLVMSMVLVLVCWAKGEKPKWRWGK